MYIIVEFFFPPTYTHMWTNNSIPVFRNMTKLHAHTCKKSLHAITW